jgi:hypothetical protein
MKYHEATYCDYRLIARQRLGRHIPAGANARKNGSVNTHKIIRDNTRRCFPWGPPRGYITRNSKGAVSFVRSCESSVDDEFI